MDKRPVFLHYCNNKLCPTYLYRPSQKTSFCTCRKVKKPIVVDDYLHYDNQENIIVWVQRFYTNDNGEKLVTLYQTSTCVFMGDLPYDKVSEFKKFNGIPVIHPSLKTGFK